MKIVICGAGLVGSAIASHLSEEHNDVTVIDASAENIQRITDHYDVHGVVGVASHPDRLAEAGVRDAELLIACLLYTSPSPRDVEESRMPSSA